MFTEFEQGKAIFIFKLYFAKRRYLATGVHKKVR